MITQNALPLPSTSFVNIDNKNVCSKPKKGYFSVLEVKLMLFIMRLNRTQFCKQSLLTIWQTKIKIQSVWKSITKKVNAVDPAQRSVTEVKDKWRNMCRDAKLRFADHRRETQKTGGGPPPAPLSQTVADSWSVQGLQVLCGGLWR